MSLNELLNQPINVKNLEMPEQLDRLGSPFDPEKDIDSVSKAKAIDNLRRANPIFMGNTALLFPYALSLDDPNTNIAFEIFKERTKKTLEIARNRLGFDYVDILSDAKIAFPKHFKLIDPNFLSHEKSFLDMMHEIGLDTAMSKGISMFALYGVPVAILYPGNTEEMVKNVWNEKSKTEVESLIEDVNNPELDLLNPITDLANITLLFPQARKLYEGKLNWNILKANLFLKKNSIHPAIARALLILAAKEAQITEDGIKIKMPKNSLMPIKSKPMPKIRRFS